MQTYNSSTIYYIACFVFLFIAAVEFYTKNAKIKNLMSFLSTLCFILFWAPRGYLFSDWSNYEPFYQSVCQSSLGQLLSKREFEIGFIVLLKIFSFLRVLTIISIHFLDIE